MWALRVGVEGRGCGGTYALFVLNGRGRGLTFVSWGIRLRQGVGRRSAALRAGGRSACVGCRSCIH
eukprot:scaffold20416_cov67-Isochrysis_galbana.AAC.1